MTKSVVLYQLASFMNLKEPTVWRWSHARHHSDTIIGGRDREIAAMRPPDVARLVVNIVGLSDAWATATAVLRHASGRVSADEATFIPESERRKGFREARVWLVVYACVVGLCITRLPFAGALRRPAQPLRPMAHPAARRVPARRSRGERA